MDQVAQKSLGMDGTAQEFPGKDGLVHESFRTNSVAQESHLDHECWPYWILGEEGCLQV